MASFLCAIARSASWKACLLLILVRPASGISDDSAFFENRIRPVFAEHCYSCHSAKAEKIQGGLRVDTKEDLLKGGASGPVIVSGWPERSLLIKAVRSAGTGLQVRSAKHAEKLLPEPALADLVKWIKLGAPIPEDRAETSRITHHSSRTEPPVSRHWAFEPIGNPPIPRVESSSWPRTAIDQFILARLEGNNFKPAPPAEKRVLIRRATFDLTGLPPTPAEVEAFLADNSPEAFTRIIDRLLASPRYGERWARHWLDVARYADSNGMDENLAYASAFRYRDYVVAAFNRDKPYDQFIREQLAGDLLPLAAPDADPSEQIIATGFLIIGPKMLAEDDPVKMEMDIIDEQLDTTCRAFLGLTVGCARCHDHKYDPISIADYYAMAGILKSTKTMENFKVVARWQERPLGPPSVVEKWQAQKKSIEKQNQRINTLITEGNSELLREERRHIGDYLLAATEKRALDRWLKGTKPLGDGLKTNAPLGLVVVEAENYQRHENVMTTTNGYGESIGVIYGPSGKPNVAEYDLPLANAAWYRIEVRYAAAESRSVKLILNGKLARSDMAGKVTGSWNPDTQTWEVAGLFWLNAGTNIVRVERADCIPHIDKFLFAPMAEAEAAKLTGVGGAISQAPQLIPEFVNQWTKYLEKTEKTTNSVLSAWHEFLASAKFLTELVAEGTNAIQPKTVPLAHSSAASVVLREGPPGSLAELARRYAELFGQADEAWRQLKSSTDGGKAEKLPDVVQESFRQILYDAQGPFAVPKNSESYFPSNQLASLKMERETLKELEQALPPLPEAMAVSEGNPVNLRIHKRGSHLSLGDEAPRGVLRLSSNSRHLAFDGQQSGRLHLANWLASPQNPLTARVMVNRIWLWHFGEGLVRSPDNFGKLGESPTHPELLDWLARQFINCGWSAKAMHRLIMNSAVYQQSSVAALVGAGAGSFGDQTSCNDGAVIAPRAPESSDEASSRDQSARHLRSEDTDPENRLWSHFNRQRLEVEAMRDAILALSGNLDLTMGGSLLPAKNRAYVTGTGSSLDLTPYESPRRALYLPVVRSALYDLFQVFDFADPSVLNGRRDRTIVAPQALFLLNSAFVARQTKALTAALITEKTLDDAARVTKLYHAAYGRRPSARECSAALQYIERYARQVEAGSVGSMEGQMRSWQSFCRAVIAANEFIYLD